MTLSVHQRALEGEVATCDIFWQGRTYRCHVEPARDPSGSIVGIAGAAAEVTDRQWADEALRASEQRYRTLIETMNDGLMVVDNDDVIQLVNDRLCGLVGYSREELLGRVGYRLLFDEEGQRLIREKNRLRTQHIADAYEVQMRTKSGQTIWVRISATPIAQPDGKVIGSFGIIADITERKRVELEIQQAEERFAAFMDNNPAIAFIKDEEGRYVYVNAPFLRLFGGSLREWALRTDAEFFAPELAARLRKSEQAVIAAGRPLQTAESIPTPDGVLREWLVFRFPVPEHTGRRLLGGVAIDVTESKKLEGDLRQAQKMEAVGRLAGGIAHDFNNLLTGILGYCDILIEDYRYEAELVEQVGEVKAEALRAASLTRQLLAFSRRQMLDPTVLDLNEVVADLKRMLGRLIGEDVELVTLHARGLWPVEADRSQIEQVIMNLALNARDAMPNGGRLTIETANAELDAGPLGGDGPDEPGPYVMLSVRDTGLGMDAETKAHLFEPFFTTKPQGKGTGLGLATIYGIVRQSGGYILVDSEPGSGAEFRVYLPRTEGIPVRIETMVRPGSRRGSETILLVEDEDSVRALASRVLRGSGYTVIEAPNADGALEKVARFSAPIELLITDVVMPRISGPELAQLLATRCPDTRVLFISGYAHDAVIRERGLVEGAAFLQKPFTADGLLSKLREVLDTPR
jgi:PAS domain S-box-containing protein